MQNLIDGVIDAQNKGQDVEPMIAMLATMPNIATGKEFGVEYIRAQIETGKEKAAKRIKAAKAKLEREALEKAQASLKAEVSAVELPESVALVLATLVAKATGLKAYVVVSAGEDGKLGFTVSGLKAPSSKSGGKPAKDQPRPFVDSEGDRIFGTLTDWARENLPPVALAQAPHKGEGDKRKLRGGGVLETFLKNEHEIDGQTYGPFVKVDNSEAFANEFAAWTEAQKAEENKGEVSEETEAEAETEDSSEA